MKILTLLSLLVCTGAYAQTTSEDIVITGGGISITVRGSGGFVCSAQDSFKQKPRLGRGATKEEAEANAHFLAAQTADGSDFFVKTITCEGSNSGNGKISITNDENGLKVSVEGPSEVQCISNNSMKNTAYPYIAEAGTQTEAFALSSNACTVGSNDDGTFCKTSCQKIASAGTVDGQVKIGGLKLPEIKLPEIKIPGIPNPFHPHH